MAIVLVVDDEFGIGELLEAVLEDDGHQALTAMNGRHALERIAQTRPDLVISDLMMPVMDGAGLLAAMKQDAALSTIPFMLMCALPESAIAHRISGYDGFLLKPFKLAQITAMVAKLLPDGEGAK